MIIDAIQHLSRQRTFFRSSEVWFIFVLEEADMYVPITAGLLFILTSTNML